MPGRIVLLGAVLIAHVSWLGALAYMTLKLLSNAVTSLGPLVEARSYSLSMRLEGDFRPRAEGSAASRRSG